MAATCLLSGLSARANSSTKDRASIGVSLRRVRLQPTTNWRVLHDRRRLLRPIGELRERILVVLSSTLPVYICTAFVRARLG